MDEQVILAGDLGGTKTNLALFYKEKGVECPVYEDSFQSRDFGSFQEMVSLFIVDSGMKPLSACFGVAGPVHDGVVNISKLSWRLSEDELQESLNIPKVTLINDLTATGYALSDLSCDNFISINKGDKRGNGTQIIVAPGTGLGETFLSWDGNNYKVHASEGGHSLFSPGNNQQIELLNHIQTSHPQVTFDLVCSGQGIPLIYDYLKYKDPSSEPKWLAQKLSMSDDITPIIVDLSSDSKKSALIIKNTVEIFVDILAAECANFALKTLADGGVYLAGGIPVRIVDFIKTERFINVFTDRQPFQKYLEKIPITVITNPKAPLIGAASHCLKMMGM